MSGIGDGGMRASFWFDEVVGYVFCSAKAFAELEESATEDESLSWSIASNSKHEFANGAARVGFSYWIWCWTEDCLFPSRTQ